MLLGSSKKERQIIERLEPEEHWFVHRGCKLKSYVSMYALFYYPHFIIHFTNPMCADSGMLQGNIVILTTFSSLAAPDHPVQPVTQMSLNDGISV